MIRALMIAVSVVVSLCAFAGTETLDDPGDRVASAVSGIDSARELFRQTLAASGVTGAENVARYEAAFEAQLARVLDKAGSSRSPYRRARRLHAFLHDTLLARYDMVADGIPEILDEGRYNCVSATLLTGILARALGLDAVVVESPRHIYLRVRLGEGRSVDIECTAPDGYDLGRDIGRFRAYVLAYKHATPEELANRGAHALFEEFHDIARPVSLERAVAFLWHNRGERALARGAGLEAAECFLRETLLHPMLAYREDSLAGSLARAFRIEYEAGEFDAAFRVAQIDLRLFPGRTTARDRLLAAAVKRIDEASEADDPRAAAAILDQAISSDPVLRDRMRLQREACPIIAAAAVRAGDWELARRMSARYAGAQRDLVEAARMTEWVERRRRQALGMETATFFDLPWTPGHAPPSFVDENAAGREEVRPLVTASP